MAKQYDIAQNPKPAYRQWLTSPVVLLSFLCVALAGAILAVAVTQFTNKPVSPTIVNAYGIEQYRQDLEAAKRETTAYLAQIEQSKSKVDASDLQGSKQQLSDIDSQLSHFQSSYEQRISQLQSSVDEVKSYSRPKPPSNGAGSPEGICSI